MEKVKTPKYPEIKVRLAGEDGNTFAMISRCAIEARRMIRKKKTKMTVEEITEFKNTCMQAGSQDEVIQLIISLFSVS